jgi:hypothetical protein
LLFALGVAACSRSTPAHLAPGAAGASAGSAAGGSTGGGGGAQETAGTAGATATAGSTGATGGAGSGGATDDADATSGGDAAAPDGGGDGIPDALADVPVEIPDLLLPPCTDRNFINRCNWNETTIHPFSQRRMLLRDEGDPHVVLLDFAKPDPVVWKTVANGPWARGLQLIGNHQLMGSQPEGYQVFDLTTGQLVKAVTGFALTQSAYRTVNGETMLAHGGATLEFLDKNDKSVRQISYPGHGYVRVARPNNLGTFLVPSDTSVFEGDAQGDVIWRASGGCLTPICPTYWSQVYEPRLMADGNVLLSTFFGASLDLIDRSTGMVTKQFGTKTMPNAATIKPYAFAGFQILPNGNIVVANWQGHGLGNGTSGVQVLEFNPAGDVVWMYKQDPLVFSSIQDVLVIDGMDPLVPHVLETSTNGSWQPATPPLGPVVDPVGPVSPPMP